MTADGRGVVARAGAFATLSSARRRTGTLEPATDSVGRGYWRAKVRLRDGSRVRVDVPAGKRYSETAARDFIAWAQEQEDLHGALYAAKQAGNAARASGLSSSNDDADRWFDAWLAARKEKGLTTTPDNAAHYRLHIRPALAAKHVRDWTSADLRGLVATLDVKIASGEVSAKYADNIWGTATKMVGDAMKSKVAALRVRDDNPARDVLGPDRGEEKAKQFLYPSEFLQLVACADVPLRWRRAIVLAVYLYPRAGELRVLRWQDVDLEHGMVHVHQAFERRSRSVKGTKTKTARRFSIEPALMPLLRAMHAEAGGKGDVCPIPNRMADRLRGWLERAGIKRRELLDETSATTKPLGWHDLRATGLTWCAVRGDAPLAIQQRAGHTDFTTTQIYIRTAEAVREGFGAAFPELPAALLEPPQPGGSTRRRATLRATDAQVRENLSGTRDSNPRHPAWEAGTLPTELVPQSVTTRTGSRAVLSK